MIQFLYVKFILVAYVKISLTNFPELLMHFPLNLKFLNYSIVQISIGHIFVTNCPITSKQTS